MSSSNSSNDSGNGAQTDLLEQTSNFFDLLMTQGATPSLFFDVATLANNRGLNLPTAAAGTRKRAAAAVTDTFNPATITSDRPAKKVKKGKELEPTTVDEADEEKKDDDEGKKGVKTEKEIAEEIAKDVKTFTVQPPEGLDDAEDRKLWKFNYETLIDPKSYVLPEKCKNPNSIRDTRTHMRQVLFALMESAAGECDRKSFKITKGGLALARGGQTTKDRKNWSEASLATSES